MSLQSFSKKLFLQQQRFDWISSATFSSSSLIEAKGLLTKGSAFFFFFLVLDLAAWFTDPEALGADLFFFSWRRARRLPLPFEDELFPELPTEAPALDACRFVNT
jgi:hypothetical protein